MKIPKLQKSKRSREYEAYSQEIRDKVIYSYLFEGKSHRALDEDIINIEASRGWQSMGILHYLGMKNDFKGIFESKSIEEAIHELKKLMNSDYRLIIEALERYQRQNEYTPNISDRNYVGETTNTYSLDTEVEKPLREVDVDTIARYAPDDEDDEHDANSMVDLSQGIKTRKARTKRHNELVKEFAAVLKQEGLQLFEGRIDCLGIKENIIGIVSEIKTLNGTKKDEGGQVMRAIGQLYYYEGCEMYQYTGMKTQKIAVFEDRISDEHIKLLRRCNILTMWKGEQGIIGTDDAMQFLKGLRKLS